VIAITTNTDICKVHNIGNSCIHKLNATDPALLPDINYLYSIQNPVQSNSLDFAPVEPATNLPCPPVYFDISITGKISNAGNFLK